MNRVCDIFDTLCTLAPLELQMSFDNAGFLLGHADAIVSCALLALDVTDDVVNEAIEKGAQLIISHHPLIFHPVKRICDDTAEGKRLLSLTENHLSVISMHTNLDIAQGGVNDVLIARLGMKAVSPLDENGCGRIGELSEPVSLRSFLSLCRDALQGKGLRYADAGKPVQRIAVMGGAGADSLARAHELGCDTYLTADIKYHQFQQALDLGINLIDGDHFYTENPVIPVLQRQLQQLHPDVEFLISSRHHAVVDFA